MWYECKQMCCLHRYPNVYTPGPIQEIPLKKLRDTLARVSRSYIVLMHDQTEENSSLVQGLDPENRISSMGPGV